MSELFSFTQVSSPIQSVKITKLLEHKFCPCHEKGLIKKITTTTYLQYKSFTLDSRDSKYM